MRFFPHLFSECTLHTAHTVQARSHEEIIVTSVFSTFDTENKNDHKTKSNVSKKKKPTREMELKKM